MKLVADLGYNEAGELELEFSHPLIGDVLLKFDSPGQFPRLVVEQDKPAANQLLERCKARPQENTSGSELQQTLLDCCNEHLRVANQYDIGGNSQGSTYLRYVANLLAALAHGDTWSTILPSNEEIERRKQEEKAWENRRKT